MRRNPKHDGLLKLIENDNINVSTKDDGISFLKTTGIVVCIILVIFFSLGFFGDIYIDNMSDETQNSIEQLFKNNIDYTTYSPSQKKYIKNLENIRNNIIAISPELQNKSPFNIGIDDSNDVNAYIYPDGTIFFTRGILKENLNNQELTFVMSHELGHYAHRDNLKSISRRIILTAILSCLSRNDAARIIANGTGNAGALSYSRKQELNADLYASEKLKTLYGSNKAAENFIYKLKDKEKVPEFFYYFSTHPSWDIRLKYLQNNG